MEMAATSSTKASASLHRVNLDEFVRVYECMSVQAKYVNLASQVKELQELVTQHRGRLTSMRVWLVSSTERGGGVAEMMPRIMCMMREMGIPAEWLVMSYNDPVQLARFFTLTKRLHNNIHGVSIPLDRWVPEWEDSTASLGDIQSRLASMYREVGTANAVDFLARFCTEVDPARDVVVIHDPQPAGMVTELRRRHPHLKIIWRCHIGLDTANDATQAAWSFLAPYLQQYDACVFSAKEYIQDSLREKSFVVHPGIAPLAAKNKELNSYDITQLLMRAGLMNAQMELLVQARGCELADAPFRAQAKIYVAKRRAGAAEETRGVPVDAVPVTKLHPMAAAGACVLASCGAVEHAAQIATASPHSQAEDAAAAAAAAADEGKDGNGNMEFTPTRGLHMSKSGRHLHIPDTLLEEGIAFLHRPTVTQISRWDRLKGWKPLLQAWVLLKTNAVAYSQGPELGCSAVEAKSHDPKKHLRMLRNACLVLAGPDPNFIRDDPEGIEVLQELKDLYDTLDADLQRDIRIVELPMEHVVQNALLVNAMQRASTVIIQNSLSEGFGLTATEAMYKRTAFIGTEQAVGLRTQVRHRVDGILVQGDASDPANVARALNTVLSSDVLREELSVNGQKRANDCFLIYTQALEWLRMTLHLLGPAPGHKPRHSHSLTCPKAFSVPSPRLHDSPNEPPTPSPAGQASGENERLGHQRPWGTRVDATAVPCAACLSAAAAESRRLDRDATAAAAAPAFHAGMSFA